MSDKWQDYYQQGTDRYISYYSDFVERFNSLLQPDIKRGRDHHKPRVRHEQEERRLEGETLNAIEEERANVQEALRMAHTGRQWATLSNMAQILVTFFDRRGYWDDWILTQRLVLDTVPRRGRTQIIGVAYNNMGSAYIAASQWGKAKRYLGLALKYFHENGDIENEGRTLTNLLTFIKIG